VIAGVALEMWGVRGIKGGGEGCLSRWSQNKDSSRRAVEWMCTYTILVVQGPRVHKIFWDVH